MNDWLMDFAMFVAQLLSLAVIVVLVVAVVARVRGNESERPRLRLEELNDVRRQRRRQMELATSSPGDRKRWIKRFRKEDKAERKRGHQHGEASRQTVWVLDFHGDIRASGTERLAEEVSVVLDAAAEGDEVVIRLESAGGLVHAYGLAAAELDRLREASLTTTVCVDKVAASGGYLMACGADQLRAAPLAVLGSIGVVAQLPNVHRLLKRHDIDVEVLTAGRYKRTLTVFGENTEEGREKFLEDLDNVHELFKQHVAERRPNLDIEAIATGETWFGSQAKERGLVDALGTSEAYLAERMSQARVISLKLVSRRKLGERLGLAVSTGVERAVERGLEVLENSRWQKR
ncbi:protease SohB [Halomonas urumqiensis]|uniref:Protease SohB n=1 Tax=Halomonas urumqiensis TaxID=1684789 RepID=A0A2N7UEJ5_9GAMM|nr:protease SohB [Halomonas urumqiensis]PMR78872.1 protease SohB [Halomonas urumqiensis]PTB04222.1 protease SohB [Halomonas urumqiensis]GHE19503.1 protease [Halomonas urumqiensis]